MKHSYVPLLFGSRTLTRAQTVDALITSYSPVGWWSMRAASGTNEPNRGSAGAAADMTITSATLAQVGQLGAGEAALCDGANTRYQAANVAGISGLTTFEYVVLLKPSSAGEQSFGAFFWWGTASGNAGPNVTFNGNVNAIAGSIYNTTPTAFTTVTTTGLSTTAYSLLFFAFDNAGDRKIHLYKGISGAVSEFTYSAQPALTGTLRIPTLPLNLWNRTDQDITFAGLSDEAYILGRTHTPAERTALTLAVGV